MARALQKIHVQFFLAGKAMTGHSGVRLLWDHPGRHCKCLKSRWVARVSKANTPGQTLCYGIFHVKIWIKSILMCGSRDFFGGFQLKLVCTFHRCYRTLPSNSPHRLEKGANRSVSCCLCSSHQLTTQMLGILKGKKKSPKVWDCWLFLFPLMLHSLMWSHWSIWEPRLTDRDRRDSTETVGFRERC